MVLLKFLWWPLSTNTIRFLPFSLSKVYIYYITFIIPLYNYLNYTFNNKKEESSLFFEINNKEISRSILSTYLRKESLKFFNKGLNLSIYRDLVLYIIKNRVLNKNNIYLISRLRNNPLDIDNLEDKLANHSSIVANNSYSRTTSLFSNTTSSIYKRSKEFSILYFTYFNLNIERDYNNLLDFYYLDLSNNKEEKKKSKSISKSKKDSISSIESNLESNLESSSNSIIELESSSNFSSNSSFKSLDLSIKSKDLEENLYNIETLSFKSISTRPSSLYNKRASSIESFIYPIEDIETSIPNIDLNSFLYSPKTIEKEESIIDLSKKRSRTFSLIISPKISKKTRPNIETFSRDIFSFSTFKNKEIENYIEDIEDSNLDSNLDFTIDYNIDNNILESIESIENRVENIIEENRENRREEIIEREVEEELVLEDSIIDTLEPRKNRRGRPRIIRTNKRGRPSKKKN